MCSRHTTWRISKCPSRSDTVRHLIEWMESNTSTSTNSDERGMLVRPIATY